MNFNFLKKYSLIKMGFDFFIKLKHNYAEYKQKILRLNNSLTS